MLDVFQKVVDHFSKKDTLSKSPSEAGGSGSSSGSNSISSATFTEALDDQSSKGANTAKDTEFKSSNSTATTILAGDDVLPALVCTLTHSASPNMYTTCFYIDNFLFFDLSSASLGYVHATLKAAVEYISHTYETLPEEKKATDDKDFFECSDKLCAEEQPQRKNSDKHPPPLMNPPLATVTAAPLPGAATRMFDKAPCLGVGTDPRSDEGLVDFLQVHKRAQK